MVTLKDLDKWIDEQANQLEKLNQAILDNDLQ